MMGGDFRIATPKPIRDFRIPFSFAFSPFRVFAIILLLLVAALPSVARERTKLIVVVANRLLLSDLDNPSLPAISKMLHTGSVGLISPNCVGPKLEQSVLLTAGSGTGCRGGVFVDEAYGAGEVILNGGIAGDEYATRTGYTAAGSGGVFLGLPIARRANADISGVNLGACGEALHRAGKKTAVVGSADIDQRPVDRSSAVLAMDAKGLIDYADFRFVPAKDDKCGMLSDVDSLTGRVRGALSRADFVVVDFGDTTRVESMKASLSDKAYAAHKAAAFRGLDRLLGALGADNPSASGVSFVLVSFSPPSPDNWNRLTPIVIVTHNKPAGLLTSPTTRTDGLIGANDFAPTVLELMSVRADGQMVGREASGVPRPHALAALHEMDMRVDANEKLVWLILLFLTFTGALAFFVTAVLVAFSLPISRMIRNTLKTCLVIGASSPLAMLLAVLAPAGVAGYAAGMGVSLVVLTAGAFAASMAFTRAGSSISLPVRLVYAATTVALVVDACFGCPLCKFSLPSSYQITGMRFYGIGNEYSAIFMSMAAMVCLFAGRLRMWATVILGAVIVVVLGSGSLGANYGDIIAAVVTFGLMGQAVWRGGFGVRHVVLWTLVGIMLMIAFASADLKLAGPTATHAGRVVGLTEKLGANYLVALVSRKMLINLRLCGTKQATWVVMAFLPFLVLWFWGIQGKVIKILGKDKVAVGGLKSILVGAVMSFIFNDSGVVMASIMIAMMVLVLVYSLLEKDEAGACRE